ncbi:Bug family tripartite tricarboxylate transporter substrate binding protein [Hydrogenophaga atypica]|uniref:Bug family tripartite tricarboxylate transporter substrate binding protein n=1 Tax=Hydrogenophaga atypica TaxID=249409 RepID=A0ABW2QFE1_9BURK
MNKHNLKRRVALAAVMASLAPWAQAQTSDVWPSRPITLVVASGAGSGVDLAAREMAQKLSASLKQPVVVENKPGGSGMLAGSMVARAKADGYTLLYSNASFVTVAPAVIKNMTYDPVKDLTPLAQTAVGGIILMVNKDVPANNLKELVALVKANPERYNYATWGNGSAGQLTMEWLKQKAGLKMEHIPYKTTPQIVNDLASGVLQIGWSDPGTPVPMIEANKIKGIAISGNNRVPRTRNVATMGEQGYPFDSVGWFGMFGPANLPKPITDRLNAEINKVQASAEMAKRMETMNFEPPPVKTADEFKAIIAADVKMWATIAKDANISGE